MVKLNTAEELADIYETEYYTDAITGGQDKRMYLYYQLINSLKQADSVDIVVSFLMESGVRMLLGELDNALKRGAKIRILTGNYLGITQPSALYLIKHKLGEQVDLRFYNEKNRSFHPKSYMFHYKEYSTIYIGSSNISRSALTSGIEWNYRFSSKTDTQNYEKFYNTFVDLFENHSVVIDDDELKRYSKNWHRPAVSKDLDRYDLQDNETSNDIVLFEPRGAQIEALCALENTRAEGARRALVQAATGVGKTYLAAFDSKKYERVLFVAHREEILKQAAESFKNVRDSDDYGFFDGESKCTDKSQFIEMFGDPIENEKGWRTIPLLQTGKCKNGMNYSSKDCGVEMHCLGVADFQDNAVIDDMSVLPMVSLKERPNTDYLLQNGDIVFVRSNGNRALVGRSVVVYPGDEPVVYSGFCIRYRKEREELLTDYLLRFFKTDSVRAKMAGRGANIQNLNQQILAALNIPIPPIEMQKEFSVFVKQSDKSKFISFKSQFIGDIQRAFDEGRVTTLGKMVEEERPITYGIVKPGHGCPGGVPVVKVKDMQDGAIDESNLLLTTPELDYQYRRSRLRTGDLLISIRGSVGRLAEIPESLENANITQDTARLTISPQYNKIYVRGVLESPILQWDMEKNIRGVAVKGINIGYLRELKMPVCSRERQDELAMLYQQSDKSK